ncbi:NAD(P)-binding protein [Aspergillus steynii IBT 23096]|uniref:NAD(P)-binding protein n=1 Tax=Aspergillus steynii IBT 23096 TaxID=1392250 RepID=A0A2I2GA49_9EURO|nr:NAD(P)-binding protein [Aspergillus steynii IBT 23096]PLB49749.1 NAD(P)-binding protein [Aspergillus steynii IBT 23096]
MALRISTLRPPANRNVFQSRRLYPVRALAHTHGQHQSTPDAPKRFPEFQLDGRVFAVTGGARGLGLTMAEALAEAGGEVYCLDRLREPEDEFHAARERARPAFGGALHYRQVDVRDEKNTTETMRSIASHNNRLDGLIAAAGVNHVQSAIGHTANDVERLVGINYTGLFTTATAAAAQMRERDMAGTILLVASMSGLIANKGMTSAIYNSSKAAVVQLTRSLAMEWGRGDGVIRVNCLCPGHIETPMARMVMEQKPETKQIWESENMLGRLARPEEFRGITALLMSDASSYMTGTSIVVDGGHTAW